MTQLQQQDPSSPSDAQAFAAQLAQFAGLEAAQETNARLDSLLMAQAGSNQLLAANMVGRTATIRSGNVQHGEGQTHSILLESGAPVQQVTVTIKDAAGATVRTLQMGAHATGQTTVAWDGLDDRGKAVPAGQYHVQAAGTGRDGAAVTVSVMQRLTIDGVSYASGVPQLVVGDHTYALSDVWDIRV